MKQKLYYRTCQVFHVKAYFPSTRKTDSGMCSINGPHGWNNRTVEELEEDADCNSSVCK